jgi:Trk-type K+ transport system membrane component
MATGHLKPHRGVLILVFGILSWVVCVIFGLLAWIWGNADLVEMDAGRMDPEGRGLTQAGRILGMINVIVFIVGLVLFLILMVLGVFAGVAAQQ